MTQESTEELNAQNPAVESPEGQELTDEQKRELSPAELARLESEVRKQQLLAQLEEENRETALGRLCRSKNFWYAVFGSIFVFIMLALIAWAARDLGYLGK